MSFTSSYTTGNRDVKRTDTELMYLFLLLNTNVNAYTVGTLDSLSLFQKSKYRFGWIWIVNVHD